MSNPITVTRKRSADEVASAQQREIDRLRAENNSLNQAVAELTMMLSVLAMPQQ